jgi:(1->4)-alpha-D-glucan 1-alpha-D-glucosylmutase
LRSYNNQIVITIVPRFFTSLIQPEEYPLGKKLWDDTAIQLPHGITFNWVNAITGERITTDSMILMGDVLKSFPVALLISNQ